MNALKFFIICYVILISTIAIGDTTVFITPNIESADDEIMCTHPNIADLKKRADVNDEKAVISLANCYLRGRGVPHDQLMAEQLLKKLADTNKPYAQYDLALFYVQILGDYQKAAECYAKAAEQGFVPAKTNLAVLYVYGKGVQQDQAKAIALFEEAAIQGDSIAQFWLAQAYVYGLLGIEKDQEKALEWMRKAAENGCAPAQSYLGDMYATGFANLSRDYEEATKWYIKSAKQGNVLGEYNLGLNYFLGQGVEQNYKIAMEWFLKAAEQGYPKAQYNVGVSYLDGKGAKPDVVKAYMWLTLAAEKGVSEGNANPNDILKRMRDGLSSNEIAEANRLVIEYKKTHKTLSDTQLHL